MPTKYLNKSNHNHNFLTNIQDDYPEDFFDWKVTVQFYTSLHKCYCVLISKGFNIETRHKLNIANIKTIDADISFKLHKLFSHSRTSRYDGFLTEEAMLRMNKINYIEGKTLMSDIEVGVATYYPVPSEV